MSVLADLSIVVGVVLAPLTIAIEGRRVSDPAKPLFLPNHIRVPLGCALWGLVLGGFYFQDYPIPMSEELNLMGRIFTAVVRTLAAFA
ncbi:hypothetical protein [Yoonia sp. BS5-3]|uniref:Uncharacterized protein n=1 Tax=Yoonia phaeophyticola TaxID=3137369 RepID=A0ABZ2V247_9RHOB